MGEAERIDGMKSLIKGIKERDATIAAQSARLGEAEKRIAQLEGERRTLICMAVDAEQLGYRNHSDDCPGGFIYYQTGEPLAAEEPWGHGAQYLEAEAAFLSAAKEQGDG